MRGNCLVAVHVGRILTRSISRFRHVACPILRSIRTIEQNNEGDALFADTIIANFTDASALNCSSFRRRDHVEMKGPVLPMEDGNTAIGHAPFEGLSLHVL